MRIDELLAGDTFAMGGVVRTVARMEHHLDEGTVSVRYTNGDGLSHISPTTVIDGVAC